MAATIVVPVQAHDVALLREIAQTDLASFERSPRGYGGDELEDHRKMMRQPERMLDTLGWDAPVEGDCEIRVDAAYLRSLLAAVLYSSLALHEERHGTREERREALREMRCALRLFEALEEEGSS